MLGNIWKDKKRIELAIFGKYLAKFAKIDFGAIRQESARFGWVWRDLAGLARFGKIRRDLAIFGHILQDLARFDIICQDLPRFGAI